MKRQLLLAISLMMLCVGANAQPTSTKIVEFTIDNKQVKRPFQVFLYAGGKEFEAKRTENGFVIPRELRGDQNIVTKIRVGKYELNFGEIPRDKFGLDWQVEIDTKPFSTGRLTREEAKRTRLVYFLRYGGSELIFSVKKCL
ncbi:MAG TPA: hypothetical protein VJU86_14850 [Pyrinomonadaceae bacterium]|nr:hypothetical protein [Pyrinomonadaceae bacterium]